MVSNAPAEATRGRVGRLLWRGAVAATLLFGVPMLSLSGCESEPSQSEQGAQHYQQYCALCHGDAGQGYVADNANALSNQSFLAIASDPLLHNAITYGREGTTMSAWGVERGGPLDAAAVDALVAFIRSWQTAPDVDLSAEPVGEGEADRGQAVYDVYCADCHGEEGRGGEYQSVSDPYFLADASDAYLHHVIRLGRPGTPMTAFSGELTPQNIDDLVVLIRSWQRPINDDPFTPPSKDLGDPVLNPNGPEPAFSPDGRFVSVADLKTAYDAGSRMVLLDARPPYDYVQGHVSGAVSVPFYEAEEMLDQLPQDVWTVAYCACPHAESGAAADVLIANGYSQVKVLDEGLPLWEELGYPMTSGPEP